MLFKRKEKGDPVLSFLDHTQINEPISYENLSIIPLTNNKIDEFKCLPFDEAIAEDLASVSEKNQEGTVYLKGEKFRLEMQNQIIFSDKKKVWNYNREFNEVTINKYKPKEMEMNPSELYTQWEKGFIYRYIKDVETNVGNHWAVLELTPIDKKKSFYKVKLYVDTKSKILKQAKIYENSQNIYTFKVRKFITNQALKDSWFTFKKSDYKGVEVIDMRE